MARPKQQHYVTRAYLDGFLAPGANQLFCYARSGKVFPRRTHDIATERNFYAYKDDKGEWDDSLEHLIERMVEAPGLPVVKKLSKGHTRLNWHERTLLAMLVAFQEVRTPAARQKTIEMSKASTERILRDIREANPDQKTVELLGKDGKSNTVTLEEIESSHADLEKDGSFELLKLTIGPAMELHKYYRHLKFTVYYPVGAERFITTDTPVIRVYEYGPGLGSGLAQDDLEVRFPLSSGALLTITHDLAFGERLVQANETKRRKMLSQLPEVRIRHIGDDAVRAFNRGHVRHARMWVYSPEQADWIPELLKERSVAPEIVDMSTKSLHHFRSKVNYDPRIDAPKRAR